MERVSPLWFGLSVAGLLLSILFVSETALDRWSELTAGGEFDALARVSSGVLRDLRIAIVHCLVTGYVAGALLHVVQSGRRSVLELQDALACDRDECERLAASIRLGRNGLVVSGLLGVGMSMLTPYIVPPIPDAVWNPAEWSPEVTWHRLLGPVVSIAQWWLGFAILTVSMRMSRIARDLRHIDLLDLAPLAPFTQQGLTNALLLIGLLSVWSLMLIETGMGAITIIISLIWIAVIVAALFLPLRGVNARIRASKQAELGRVNQRIATRREAMLQSDAMSPSGEMADLVAYRGLIENVPEWPISLSNYSRLFLYAMLPIASWSLGVLAEALVESLLL